MRTRTIIVCCIGIVLCLGCSFTPSKSEFDDKAILEDVMEMQLPNYKVKRYGTYSPTFHGDFINRIYIEFDSIPSQTFIDSVNLRVAAEHDPVHRRWLKHGEHQYRFQSIDDDGGRTPKCREGEVDWIINFEFSNNCREAVIEYGYY
ncbi:MAG: hypothetical protein J5630_08180 [Bacteroidaceae bacterium]|nr:hypothetical protein [Bacteroidaceae bacterium]